MPTLRDRVARRSALLLGVASASLVAIIAAGSFLTSRTPDVTERPTIAAGALSRATAVPPASSAAPTTSSASPAGSVAPARPVVTGAAPTSAVGFRLRKTVVPMRFPFKYGARYSYSNNFLVRRVGTPLRYTHAWVAKGSTVLRRAHDGVDIDVPTGTAVLAPFDGTVIDPATRWTPWRRDRYGIAAVIESVEPTSPGYVAIMAHLSRLTVRIGERVERGDVVGFTGRTGNAETTRPHLHFELRAPFRLSVRVAGKVRRIDAFDPYPSLVGADPKRRTTAEQP